MVNFVTFASVRFGQFCQKIYELRVLCRPQSFLIAISYLCYLRSVAFDDGATFSGNFERMATPVCWGRTPLD